MINDNTNRYEKKQAIFSINLGCEKFYGLILRQPTIKDCAIMAQQKRKLKPRGKQRFKTR